MHFSAASPASRPCPNANSPEFHLALRDALFSVKELAGTQGIYNFTPASSYGVDERALVLLRLDNGAWKYVP